MAGAGTLFGAMARLGPSVRLLLAGPGDQGPGKAPGSDLGLTSDRCEFLGRVPYESMPTLYRPVGAGVLPSFTGSCPMGALEALAGGTPLIAAGAGGGCGIGRGGGSGRVFPGRGSDGAR